MKVILMSGYTVDSPAQELMDMGAQGFLQKPFTMETLSERLKGVFAENAAS
jgi:DNA-binding NtrC family response regulator